MGEARGAERIISRPRDLTQSRAPRPLGVFMGWLLAATRIRYKHEAIVKRGRTDHLISLGIQTNRLAQSHSGGRRLHCLDASTSL